MPLLSRREFLKLSGAVALGLARPPEPEEGLVQREGPIGLGRVIRAQQRYDEPSFAGNVIATSYADTVLRIYEERTSDTAAAPAGTEHNLLWYRVDDGWLYSGFVQPVRNALNRPIALDDIPPEGFLAEVTVPFTDAWHDHESGTHIAYRFYYSQTHWVDQAVTDRLGQVWYRVLDDRFQVYYFVLAEHLRRVAPEELTPLSPDVEDKRIEVDLGQQMLTAYEDGRTVFAARVSTGRPGVETPSGELRVERKRPSRHMAANDGGGNGFDLPGVPWVAYVHWNGAAFHGTYWHNDYGRPRSRGCINLSPADAKWVYRWTLPLVPAQEAYVRDAHGTFVSVF